MKSMKRYLGDGVYADFDGYHVVLTTLTEIIYLEPTVLEDLFSYCKELSDMRKDARSAIND